jgi:hypothetical protein
MLMMLDTQHTQGYLHLFVDFGHGLTLQGTLGKCGGVGQAAILQNALAAR